MMSIAMSKRDKRSKFNHKIKITYISDTRDYKIVILMQKNFTVTKQFNVSNLSSKTADNKNLSD